MPVADEQGPVRGDEPARPARRRVGRSPDRLKEARFTRTPLVHQHIPGGAGHGGRPLVDERPQARLDLVAVGCAVIALGRLADDTAAWLIAALLVATMLLGSLRVFQASGDARLVRWPIESLVTPAVAAVGAFGAFRLVPLGLGLLPGIAGAAALIWLAFDLEARVLARKAGPTVPDRTAILAVGLLSAFLAFAGVAGLVPGGLAEPGSSSGLATGPGTQPLSEASLIVLAGADALVALLVGYRFAALRVGHLRPAVTAAVGYALAIAIAAGLLRAAALPRLLGPAVLTLVLFLWDAIRGASPAARRDPRFVWQVALLAVLGIVVVAWNVGLR